MELTQPAVIALIDYLYTGCLQASSSIMVLLETFCSYHSVVDLWPTNKHSDELAIHFERAKQDDLDPLQAKLWYGQSSLQEAGPSS